MRKMLIAVVAITALLGAVSAGADVITFDNTFALLGSATGTVSGVTFTANGGVFEAKKVVNYWGVGVSGGASGGEIDIGQSITATFGVPAVIDYLDLDFLFNGPEYGDVLEVAQVKVNGGPTYTLTTSVVNNTATWTGAGSVSNLSLADLGSDAVWRISNPFGSVAVTSLEFTALTGVCGTGDCNNQSDYSLGEVAFTPVPEPGTLLLLGAGLAGLRLRGRRKK